MLRTEGEDSRCKASSTGLSLSRAGSASLKSMLAESLDEGCRTEAAEPLALDCALTAVVEALKGVVFAGGEDEVGYCKGGGLRRGNMRGEAATPRRAGAGALNSVNDKEGDGVAALLSDGDCGVGARNRSCRELPLAEPADAAPGKREGRNGEEGNGN
jgi:hypothetical protein